MQFKSKFAVIVLTLLVLIVAGHAQQPMQLDSPWTDGAPLKLPLWEHGAPGALGNTDEDQPTLLVFRAAVELNPGTAVIIAPGGGYEHLAINKEGYQEAYWFNSMGVTAFVLKYRLGPRYRHPVELGDAQRAIRLVRSRAREFGVAPDRIGMMGFSAGGHLTSTAATHFDDGQPNSSDPIERVSSRPDFAVLCYPVISFDPAITHGGSSKHLLGDNADSKSIELLSNDLQVTAKTPPAFLFHTSDDGLVPVENSVRYYMALRKAGVPAEMHLYETGPHGVGMASWSPALNTWPTLLANWMRSRGLLTKPAAARP